ncbi:MAG: hypothetical protein OXI39_11085 [Gemmatimonadota bacterium]|uniref:hypothetical protein n=1 Tax=Candidatus Palauibacter scopulicola TaxID=3056741 RepID=UPI00238B3A0F|nr:hypothetical protein [Candidatus Palauibacter scopulicola]MDE2663531.1 hypothetical protein [Candidatus Palauibacter scopulicola]
MERTTSAVLAALGAMTAMVAGCAPEIGPGAEGSADANDASAVSAPPASPVRRPPAAPVAGGAVAEPGGAPEMTYTMVTVQAGAELEVELIDAIRTGDLRPGDALKFGVTRPLIENHVVLVPLNSLINGEITAVGAAAEDGDDDEAGGAGERVMVKVHFVDVFFNGASWPLSASVVEVMPGPGGEAATGGAAGMNLGRVLAGGRQGAVAGAAAGAARGSAVLLAADGAGPALPAGTILRLRLDEPLVFGLPNS